MSKLFENNQLGPLQIKNRLVVAPMCQYSAADGCASDWHLQHLSNLACSGAGTVMIEATAVERIGRISHACLGLYSDMAELALKKVITFVKSIRPDVKIGIQLAHAGRKASTQIPWHGGGPLTVQQDAWPTVSSSAVSFDNGWHLPSALSVEQIRSITQHFAHAARRAASAGVDIIEIHATHGYLLHQFMSPLVNRRKDEYGGSFDNRVRFALEVVDSIKNVMPPHMALGMRITGSDWHPEGWQIEDACQFARLIKDGGVHYACVSSGGIIPHVHIPVKLGYQVEFASKVRKASGIITRAVGMIRDPQQAEDILQRGDADLIALARAFLYNPRWGWHAAVALGDQPDGPPQYERGLPPLWKP
jgi:2,4-dienoyl-CoA reductase-like NADH-dependent reductase (Old Yellow Enzyme family)